MNVALEMLNSKSAFVRWHEKILREKKWFANFQTAVDHSVSNANNSIVRFTNASSSYLANTMADKLDRYATIFVFVFF